MDPIKMLKDDHRKVEKLFARYDELGERATTTKLEIVRKITAELRLHAEIEETIVYPLMRKKLENMDDDVLEAYEEHHLVKRTLDELEEMIPQDDMYDAKVCVLCEAIDHHVKEEEDELFPKLKKACDKDELQALGEKIQAAKKGDAIIQPERRREAA